MSIKMVGARPVTVEYAADKVTELEKALAELQKRIADSVNQIWDIYWSGLGLSDQDLVDAIVEHIKDMK